jgi:FtsP/CotA-like multicopper oxidase with cupredoxin domain
MHPRLNLSRRHVLASLAGATNLFLARRGVAATASLAVTIREDAATGAIFDPPLPSRFALGARLRVNITDALRVPVALGFAGFDGLRDFQPFGRPLLEPGATLAVDVPLNQSGTFLFEGRPVDDGSPLRLPKAALAVAEASPPGVDQDRILLIEDARRLADVTPSTAGSDPAAVLTTYSVNGQPTFDLEVRANERLRLRVVNGCHRNAIALQFDNHDLRVIAIDSRPAEPFVARDRRLVLAPGTRIDTLVDATAGATSPIELFDGTKPRRIGQLTYAEGAPVRPQPLPLDPALNDPSARLDLASALRIQIDLTVGGLVAADFVNDRTSPVFRVKRGRTVLCALANLSTTPTTVHLHGHHFRWLDRLDDGWKPFTPDTLLLDAGQTERIAFVAQYPGDWLIEAVPMDWSQPRRLRWFAVE